MTTALPDQHHHHLHVRRSQAIAVGAGLLAVLAAGAVLEVAQDDPQATSKNPEVTLSLTPHHLHGSGHMETEWQHAGTTSGGRTMLGQ
jgi:hypothetical protein